MKTLKQIKEDAPANSMGAAGTVGLGTSTAATVSGGGIAGFDPIITGMLRRRPLNKTVGFKEYLRRGKKNK